MVLRRLCWVGVRPPSADSISESTGSSSGEDGRSTSVYSAGSTVLGTFETATRYCARRSDQWSVCVGSVHDDRDSQEEMSEPVFSGSDLDVIGQVTREDAQYSVDAQ
jgi:hypothetical protein